MTEKTIEEKRRCMVCNEVLTHKGQGRQKYCYGKCAEVGSIKKHVKDFWIKEGIAIGKEMKEKEWKKRIEKHRKAGCNLMRRL